MEKGEDAQTASTPRHNNVLASSRERKQVTCKANGNEPINEKVSTACQPERTFLMKSIGELDDVDTSWQTPGCHRRRAEVNE